MTVRRSIVYSFTGQQTAFIIQFASNVLIARLLTPTEIGVFSVTVGVIALIHSIRDFGVNRYLIQERSLTEEKIRSAFGVILMLGILLFLILFLGRNLVADFYGEPDIGHLLFLLSLNFLIIPFGAPALTMMQREMKFAPGMIIGIVASVVSAGVAIGLAFLDFGSESLAWASLSGTGVTAAGALIARPSHFGMLPSFSHTSSVIKFGSIAVLVTIVTTIGQQAPELIIGKLIDMRSVGLFSRAMGLTMAFALIIKRAVGVVAAARFAEINRAGEDLCGPYTYYSLILMGIAIPSFAVLMVFADPVIRLLFGGQWGESVPVLQVLCIMAILETATLGAHEVYIATGQMRLMLRSFSVIYFIGVPLIILGASYGLIEATWARFSIPIIATIMHLAAMHRIIDLRARTFLRALLPSVWVGAGVLAFSFLFVWLVGPPNQYGAGELGLLAVLGVPAYIVILRVVRHPLFDELQSAIAQIRWRKPR